MSSDLAHLVATVEELQAMNTPQVTLDVLVAMHGARSRFIGGTHELRLGGVAGTCTSGWDKPLIESWLRAARRKLERISK